jgi:hypothetical protein
MELGPPEKRCDARFSCRAPVEWAYFNKPDKHNARMLNYSQTGACFECAEALVNGATIMVRLEAYRADCGSGCRNKDECPWPRSIGLGEVKWCLGLPGIGVQRFGVGVKFHLPI